jgi:hypothetical protein
MGDDGVISRRLPPQPHLTAGTQTSVGGVRGGWRMPFVPDGRTALG